MIDMPGLKEVPRKLWAFLGPLAAGDATVHSVFANCPRHNGLESWRHVAKPINEDKLLILKDLLLLVTNPKPATNLDDLAQAAGGSNLSRERSASSEARGERRPSLRDG